MKYRTLVWTMSALLAATRACVRDADAMSYTLHPPALVLQQLDALKRVERVADLPAPIRDGAFEGAPSPVGWPIAEPDAAWNATDVVSDPKLPGRRLYFAACSDALCLVHYAHGGIAFSVNVVAIARRGDRWKAIWSAYGSQPIRDLPELRAVLRNRSRLHFVDACANGTCSVAILPPLAGSSSSKDPRHLDLRRAVAQVPAPPETPHSSTVSSTSALPNA